VSHSLKEEYKLQVSENRVLTKIYCGPWKDKANEHCRMSSSDELCDLYEARSVVSVVKSVLLLVQWSGNVAVICEEHCTVERQLPEFPINRINAIKDCVCCTNIIIGLFQTKCLKILIYNYIY
jgi:hypothetical protein